ncbi:hypothetical protein [Streptomyces sp. SYSU K217416]
MAGESPDKSEQQGSSGESTPAESDPRLSVFREPKVSTDQPTAVFKMPRPTEPSEAGSGDSRLRAAVAAWVATAEDETPSPATRPTEDPRNPAVPEARDPKPQAAEAPGEEPPQDAEPARGSGPAGPAGESEPVAGGDADAQPRGAGADRPAADAAAPAAGEPARGSGSADGVSDSDSDADAKPSRGAGADEAGRPAAATGADADASHGAEPARGSGPADRATAEGVAAKAAPAARDPKPVADREPSGGAGADEAGRSAAEPAGPSRGAEPAGGSRPVAGASVGDADVKPTGADADASRGAEPARGPGASAEDVAQKAAPAARDPKPAVDREPSREASADKPDRPAAEPARGSGSADGASDSDADAKPSRGAGADAEASRDARADKAGLPSAGANPSGEAAEPDRSSGARAGQDAPGADAKGVDQPTAVFKAVRPPAPKRESADRATTAFKAVQPPAAKPKPKPEPGAKPKPESGAERSSKFVPLKPTGASASATALPESERTKQQPLPPKPPLDLLAELTNTPPPEPTPVRTAVWRVKIWTPLVLLLGIVFAVVQAVRPLPDPQLSMTAKSTFAFEGEKPSLPWPADGQAFMAASGLGTVGSSGEQKPVPIASVTKAMTAYVILKNHPLKEGEDGPSIPIDAKGEAEGQLDKSDGESTLNTVKEGDKLTLRDALAAIMIPSANNIARQLARWDAGSEEAFVKKMNEAAEELGMKNTTYTDPSGLDATTVSTAEDQVKLGLELVEIPALMDITKLPSWEDPSGKNWRNWNELVPFNGALGIKTGSTTKAGGNLLFAAHKKVGATDQLIVGAVLAQHDTPILGTAIQASKDIMLATQELLESRVVVKKGDVVGHVDDGLGGTTPVVATKDVNAVGWPGLTVKIELTDGGSAVPHSAAAGTEVGTLTVGEGASQVKVPVALQAELTEPSFGDKLTRVA